jgi:hypothetical protein
VALQRGETLDGIRLERPRARWRHGQSGARSRGAGSRTPVEQCLEKAVLAAVRINCALVEEQLLDPTNLRGRIVREPQVAFGRCIVQHGVVAHKKVKLQSGLRENLVRRAQDMCAEGQRARVHVWEEVHHFAPVHFSCGFVEATAQAKGLCKTSIHPITPYFTLKVEPITGLVIASLEKATESGDFRLPAHVAD